MRRLDRNGIDQRGHGQLARNTGLAPWSDRLLLAVGLGAAAVAMVLFAAGSADALQLPLGGGERLHTITSGQPGAAWNTAGAGDMVSYDGAGNAVLTGVVDDLNYFDAGNGSCPTDAGSNCTADFAPDLDFSLTATFNGVRVNPLGGSFVEVLLDFETAGGASDLTLTDPTDLGAGNLLSAVWVAGEFQGQPTTGLTVSITYDTVGGTVFGDPTATGFLQITGGAYASLFAGDYFGLTVGSLFGHSPSIESIVATAIGSGSLPAFTSEGQGQVFRVASGDFVVPEPGTLSLVAAGLLGLTFAGRRRRS